MMTINSPITQHQLLTLREAAVVLRCSRSQLHRILGGKLLGLPPLPALRIGRRTLIRQSKLDSWIILLEAQEREISYASGFFGIRDDEYESIAGA